MRVCATWSAIVPRVDVVRGAIHGCWRGTGGPAGMSPKYFSAFALRDVRGVMSPTSTSVVFAAP